MRFAVPAVINEIALHAELAVPPIWPVLRSRLYRTPRLLPIMTIIGANRMAALPTLQSDTKQCFWHVRQGKKQTLGQQQ